MLGQTLWRLGGGVNRVKARKRHYRPLLLPNPRLHQTLGLVGGGAK